MINRDETYIIDIERENYIPPKKVKQFDTLKFEYNLYKDSLKFNIQEATAEVRILRADNGIVIKMANIQGNKISFEVDSSVTKVPGLTKLEIRISRDNKQISTFNTSIDIVKSVLNTPYTKENLVEIIEELNIKLDMSYNVKEELNEWIDANKDIVKINERINNNAKEITNLKDSVARNEDIVKINERINNSAKEITNLKDSIAKNEPIVIGESTPIGSIVWYSSEKILGKMDEDYWRVCNGQTLNKADFPELYDLIKDNPNYTKTATTFNLPDLISSKRFIRSVGDSYNVGYSENDELKSHRHSLVNSNGKRFEISGSSTIGATNNAVDTFFVSGAAKPNKVGRTTDEEAWMYATSTDYVGGDETRPKNIQFIPLIKCKGRTKYILDLATDVEQSKEGFNTLKEAMNSKATKESINEITEEISNIEGAILDTKNELEEARNGEILMANCLIDIIELIEESEYRMEKGIKNLSELRNLVDSLLNKR